MLGMTASPRDAAEIVAIAGGKIVGRTRLQKVTCLLDMIGMQLGFSFEYHLHGPYSEKLRLAVSDADALGLISVDVKKTEWGGQYFVYCNNSEPSEKTQPFRTIAQKAASAGSIELELMVTALFLAKCGSENPWDDVVKRKREKATPERLEGAKTLLRDIRVEELSSTLPVF
jgi:uncharacterized protein